jgi:hypothetical protein
MELQDLDFDNIVNDYPTLDTIHKKIRVSGYFMNHQAMVHFKQASHDLWRAAMVDDKPLDHIQLRHMIYTLEALGECAASMRNTGSNAELPIVENIRDQVLAWFDENYDVAVYALAEKQYNRPHRGDNHRRVLRWFDKHHGTEFLS